MCGRFALSYPPAVLQEWYAAIRMPVYTPRYNIAPGDTIVVVRPAENGRIGALMLGIHSLVGKGSRRTADAA